MSYREKWWIFGENNISMRQSLEGLNRFMLSVRTARHRLFQFAESSVLPESKLITIGSDDAFVLGVLSSRLHVCWANASGGWLGIGNDATYNHTDCFNKFPFPNTTDDQQIRIRAIAEQLDAHRKRRQADHSELTLTGMYNVLEKLRAGTALTAKDKTIHTQGLVSVLRELHDNLDRAVFAAYGWDDLAERLVGLPGATTPLPDKPAAQTEAEEELLRRLVALNAERAAEESHGRIRWLRPDYQNPGAAVPEQTAADLRTSDATAATPAAKVRKPAWPKGMREQIAAVRDTLGNQTLTLEDLSARFKDPAKTTPLIVEALAALEELGRVERANDGYRMAG
jgi:hypothetical protein